MLFTCISVAITLALLNTYPYDVVFYHNNKLFIIIMCMCKIAGLPSISPYIFLNK